MTFQGRLTRYFTGQAQYRLSKTYNNTSGIISFPANSYDPKAEWARADPDLRNRLNLLGTIDASRWFDLGMILELYSGKPFDITTGADNNRDGHHCGLDEFARFRCDSLHADQAPHVSLRD